MSSFRNTVVSEKSALFHRMFLFPVQIKIHIFDGFHRICPAEIFTGVRFDDRRVREIIEELPQHRRRIRLRNRGNTVPHRCQAHIRCQKLVQAFVDRTRVRCGQRAAVVQEEFRIAFPFKATPLKAMLEEKLKKSVNIENDANCAALGEIKFGAAKGCINAILLTLGTGVGGGIIIDGKIYKGATGVGGELGHMIVEVGGKPCPCGFCGCFEQYASATALVTDAKEAAEKNPGSILGDIYKSNGNTLDGKDVFEAIDKNCPVAGVVLDKYLTYLAAGIDSIYSIFDPEAVILTGGITNRKDVMLPRLKEKMRSPLRVEISQLKSDAGSFGAAML